MEETTNSGGLVILNNNYVPNSPEEALNNVGVKTMASIYRADPMEVYLRAKAGEQFPATPSRLPIEFERNSKNYVVLPEKEPGVHRLEFIIWKGYWICNVEINSIWHTCSFPNTTSMIEFLAAGQINKAAEWPKGRAYTNE